MVLVLRPEERVKKQKIGTKNRFRFTGLVLVRKIEGKKKMVEK